MNRLLASILSLALAAGSTPAAAQTALGRVSLGGTSAPTPVPAGVVPSATGLSLAAPTAALTLAPALALTPAPSALAPIAAMPALAASVGESRIPTPIESLKIAAAPEGLTSFDGSLTRSAASTSEEPPVVPDSAAPPAKRGLLQRYKDSRKKTPPLQTAFGRGMFFAAITATTIPALIAAAPAMKIAYAFTAADLLVLVVILPLSVGLWAWRKLRSTPVSAKPPPRSKQLLVFTLGAMLGLGAGIAPYYATGPVAERVANYSDGKKDTAERQHVRWITGGAVEDETIKVLSRNEIGRATLDALRDRLGVIRLPTFFISHQDDSYGEHENFFDGVYLNEDEVTSRGWTIEQFLKDPALQRQLIREMNSTVLHELTHAVQGRRPPWTPGYFTNTTEAEQEAFFQEMLYRVAELERDPAARNNDHDQWMPIDAADNIDNFLKSIAAMYEKNKPIGRDPYFNAYMAAQRARWPSFRVHIYQVLASRANTPASAKMYMDKAKAAAKEAGLPVPDFTATR